MVFEYLMVECREHRAWLFPALGKGVKTQVRIKILKKYYKKFISEWEDIGTVFTKWLRNLQPWRFSVFSYMSTWARPTWAYWGKLHIITMCSPARTLWNSGLTDRKQDARAKVASQERHEERNGRDKVHQRMDLKPQGSTSSICDLHVKWD